MADERDNTGSSGTTQGEGVESRHHHHHHHHRSGSSSQSVTYRPSGSGDYSLRTFGKGSSRPPTAIPEGTLPVAVFSVLFTALLLAPVTLTMFFRNKTLAETNFQLREQLGTLMSQIEEQGQNVATVAKPSVAPRTRYVADEPPVQPEKTVQPSAKEVADVAAETRRVSDEAIASAVGMTTDEIKALRRDMRLLPNGMRMVEDENGGTAFERDVLAQNIQNAFNLLAVGQKRDAEAIFDMIASAKPQWPYGHFFAGLAGGNREKMSTAIRLFSTARAIGAMTPEGELYSAQALLFTKSTASAASSINRVAFTPVDGRDLQIGPVYAPSSTPPDILAKLRGIKGVGDVRVVDW
jgi:hypothetical protein